MNTSNDEITKWTERLTSLLNESSLKYDQDKLKELVKEILTQKKS